MPATSTASFVGKWWNSPPAPGVRPVDRSISATDVASYPRSPNSRMASSSRRSLVGLDVAGTASVNTEEDSVASEVVQDDDPSGEGAAHGTPRRHLRPG